MNGCSVIEKKGPPLLLCPATIPNGTGDEASPTMCAGGDQAVGTGTRNVGGLTPCSIRTRSRRPYIGPRCYLRAIFCAQPRSYGGRVDSRIKALAMLKASSLVGCPF